MYNKGPVDKVACNLDGILHFKINRILSLKSAKKDAVQFSMKMKKALKTQVFKALSGGFNSDIFASPNLLFL